jgi:hypothetical protein
VSFHSYKPNYYISNSIDFLSIDYLKTVNLHKHANSNYQTYYGIKNDFILDFTINENPNITKVFTNLKFNTEFNLNNNLQPNVFYNKLMAYNSYQTTGEKQIQVITPNNPFGSLNELTVKNIENNYLYSNLRDFSLSYTQSVINNDYLDLRENTTNVNHSKSLFSTQRLNDKYLNVRLWSNNQTNYNIKNVSFTTTYEVSER